MNIRFSRAEFFALPKVSALSDDSGDNPGLSKFSPQPVAMDRYFMSRTSAVALLVEARRAITDGLEDKQAHEASRDEQKLKHLERLLLDVRIGRIRDFELDYLTRMHVIITT